MGAVVRCSNCGHVHQVILSDAEYPARFGRSPDGDSAGQRGRQEDPNAPICGCCGVN